MNSPLAWVGGALVFLAEVLMYVGLVVLALHLIEGPIGWLAGLGAVVTVATLWMRHLSPKATKPLRPHTVAVAVRELVLLAGAAAWYASDYLALAIALAALAIVGSAIALVWPFVHPPQQG